MAAYVAMTTREIWVASAALQGYFIALECRDQDLFGTVKPAAARYNVTNRAISGSGPDQSKIAIRIS